MMRFPIVSGAGAPCTLMGIENVGFGGWQMTMMMIMMQRYQLVGRWISYMGKVQNWNRFIVLVQRISDPTLIYFAIIRKEVIPRRSRHIPGSWLNVNPFYSLIIIILLASYSAGQVFDTLNRLTNKLIPQSAPRSPNYRVFLLHHYRVSVYLVSQYGNAFYWDASGHSNNGLMCCCCCCSSSPSSFASCLMYNSPQQQENNTTPGWHGIHDQEECGATGRKRIFSLLDSWLGWNHRQSLHVLKSHLETIANQQHRGLGETQYHHPHHWDDGIQSASQWDWAETLSDEISWEIEQLAS